jgi:hypothetical protein
MTEQEGKRRRQGEERRGPMTEQEEKRGAGRERSGAAPRTRPALCRGFSRLVWDVGVGAQRKAAL